MVKLTVTGLLLLLVSSQSTAEIRTQKVAYEQAGVKLEGLLAWDDSSSAKRPGVLVVHEWWGLDDYASGRAEQLAALGYVAFALDMYGTGKHTRHLTEAGKWSSAINKNVDAWRARAVAGLEVLKKHEAVDANRLAAIGYCFGGATVMELAYAGTEPVAEVRLWQGEAGDGDFPTTVRARLLDPPRRFVWSRWEAAMDLPTGPSPICISCVDRKGTFPTLPSALHFLGVDRHSSPRSLTTRIPLIYITVQ